MSLWQVHTILPNNLVPVKNEPGSPLIKSLDLLTQASLGRMKMFYVDTIGFSLISYSSTRLIMQGGLTRITFEQIENAQTRPFYHFAFNIPENKIQSAFEWQRKLTPIIHPSPTGPLDEITHFPHWDAHSIFFLDPAGNLVEYIARHALDNSRKGPFTTQDILYASEIGFIANDVKSTGDLLLKHLKLKEYRPLTNNFWPIGDEHGLLLLIEKGKE